MEPSSPSSGRIVVITIHRHPVRSNVTTSLWFTPLEPPEDKLNRLMGGLLIVGGAFAYGAAPAAIIPWELGLASWGVWNWGLGRGIITLLVLIFIRWWISTVSSSFSWELSSNLSELAAGALCSVWLDSRRRGWKRARRFARRDFLTQIPNRPAFLEAVEAETERARGGGHSFAIAWLDCDGFKQLNDSRGHAAGDAALVLMGQLLSEAVREGDLVGRLGGDEFAILLAQVRGKDAPDVLEHILKKIHEGLRAFYPELSLSVGAVLSDGKSDEVADLLNQADKALYRAKALGRGRTVWAECASQFGDHLYAAEEPQTR